VKHVIRNTEVKHIVWLWLTRPLRLPQLTRPEVEAIYRRRNPHKMADVTSLMEKHKGPPEPACQTAGLPEAGLPTPACHYPACQKPACQQPACQTAGLREAGLPKARLRNSQPASSQPAKQPDCQKPACEKRACQKASLSGPALQGQPASQPLCSCQLGMRRLIG
jgi:hypothetical protein